MKKIQNVIIGLLVICLVTLTIILAVNNKQPVFLLKDQQDNLFVMGSYDTSVESDIAKIYLKIATLENTATRSRDENAKLSTQVTNSLLKIGVKKSQIETSNFNLYKKENWNPKTEQIEFKGYELTHVLKVTTEDLDEVSTIIDTSINNGANGIDNVIFDLTKEKQKKIREEAMDVAAKNAVEKAKALAKSLNVKLGKINSIAESNYVHQPYYLPVMAESLVKETPISPGKVEVSASVSITYKI